MYNAVAKYNGAYAVMNTDTAEVEALRQEDIKALLYFGIQIQGLSFDTTGGIVETIKIDEMTDEDVTQEEEEYEDYEDEYDMYEEEPEELEDDEYYEDDPEEIDDEYYEDDEDYGYEDEEEDDGDFLYDDDDIYYEDEYEKSTVQKLYDFLDTEQVKLLKRYYLWYSQRLFVEANKDPNLGMKDKNRIKAKQEALDQLRNTGGMWHYAGFIDMGYEGGYCTLGHPLRYMHIAWDVSQADLESSFFGDNFDLDIEDKLSSTNCIIFGIKCISDFFEVDAECTASLQRAQRESIKDMGIMFEQYNSGNANEVNATFKVLDDVMRRIKVTDAKGMMFDKNYKPLLKDGYIKFYEQFRNAMMPVPKSLIQEIRDSLVDWTSHKFYRTIGHPGANFGSNMVSLYARLKPMESELKFTNNIFYYTPSLSESVYRFYRILFTYKICGVFEYDAQDNKDEGGSSENTRRELAGLYQSMRKHFFKDCEYTQDYAVKVADFVSNFSELDKEFNELVTKFYVNPFVLEVGADKACELCRIKSGEYTDSKSDLIRRLSYSEDRQYNIVLEKLCRNKESIESYLEESRKYISYMKDFFALFEKEKEESDKKKADMVEERKRLEELAEKDVEEYATFDDIVEYMYSHPEPVTGIKKFGFAERIWKEMVSKNQKPKGGNIPYIEKLYTHLTGRPVRSSYNKMNISDYPDYITAVNYIVKNGSGFIRDVCVTVSEKGVFTPKQKIYLDEAITLYNSQTGSSLKSPDIK